jgi:O-acetyl-ADP-ribose deacetylase (regulator of RNase III)
MIKNVEGDILLSQAEAIAHGVAPNDNYHQGLALALREKWPQMYKDFRHYCHDSHPKAGDIWAWQIDGRYVISLFTQEAAYGHGSKPGKAHMEYVNHALRALHKYAEKNKLSSIALPRLATGVGGLDWEDIEPLIERHLKSLKIPIYVYTVYHKDQRAEEAAKGW